MDRSCLAEFCANWTGDGCARRVFGIEPVDAREPEDRYTEAEGLHLNPSLDMP